MTGPLLIGQDKDGVTFWAVEVVLGDQDGSQSQSGDKPDYWVPARALSGVTFGETTRIGRFEAAVAGKGVALLNWHRSTEFCGHTGESMLPLNTNGFRESP